MVADKTFDASMDKSERGRSGAKFMGMQLRAFRRQRQMTLDDLAAVTGLNKGYLSRLERSKNAPSIATLMKLAGALGLPVSSFFGETVDDAAIHVFRNATRGPADGGKDDLPLYVPVSQAVRTPQVEAFIVWPSPEFGSDGRVEHRGTEIVFVISGAIEVQFIDRTVSLNQGDLLQFPGHLPHQVRRVGDPASALIIITHE
jgi:transcriptional regulator with XRE-family HTH domain